MRSTEKTILFARATVNKSVRQWPVAVFNSPVAAKTYAAYLKMAHSSGDLDRIKQLDPRYSAPEGDDALPEVKFSVATVAYEPSPTVPLPEVEIDES
jgi:hypothetical protein